MLTATLASICLASVGVQTPVGEDRRSQSFRVGKDKWSILYVENPADHDNNSIRILRNGRRALGVSADDLRGTLIQAARVWYPVPWPVVVVSGHSGAGHGEQSDFYGIRNGKLFRMLRLNGEKGGPIFRDFDIDGVLEWVFDNFDWYEQSGNGPTKFLVYKLRADGSVKLWKTLPNPKRKYVGMPWYRYF